ncbi:hypothetical protein SBY92_005084 [Candida maltosa Xu316]|uniref:Uncharacterized protein n=1 Tax=Candida maltosa (strain Xu316) TaxID=1245528 RepID=M3IN13_CANMX|nr:hypothetical protein G210_1747 [Candida maltosa Xu316]
MNNTKQSHQPQQKLKKLQNYDTTSSILSDYEELELIDDNSYVLFNPKSSKQKGKNNESDILSLTNTTNDVYHSATDDDDEEEVDDEDYYSDDERDSTEVLNTNNLSHKINSWYTATSQHHSKQQHLMEEKIATWELDEGDHQILQESSNSLEQSKSILKDFYGDDLFKYLNHEEREKFKKFHKMIDIKNYLLDKNHKKNTFFDQLLYKVLLLKEKNNSNSVGYRHFNIGTTDYINYLTKDIPQNYQTYVEPVTFSDTTNGSSLIMCGGPASSSWNDI